MQLFANVTYETSDQHKEAFNSRVIRDHSDSMILNFLLERNPFESRDELISLMTGEVASASVNVYKAWELGESIIQGMFGASVFDYSFSRKDMPKTMKTNNSVIIEDIPVQVDPQLFFQRLILFVQNDNVSDAFSYELCVHPPALFEENGLMNEADKPKLVKELKDLLDV